MPLSRARALLFLKGMAMGAADSVPGVSGGTIAFIANIYDELLGSIRSIDVHCLYLLFTAGPRAAFMAINGPFLLTLGLGILSALVLSARLVLWLLANEYSYLMCFFNGLILASLWYVAGQVPRWDWQRGLNVVLGATASVAVALLPNAAGGDSLLFYFASGAVAICAMILPGISGAFVLLLLGAYEPVLTALTTLDLRIVLVFGAGCLCGLLGFSRLLYWLLQHRRSSTLAVLLGFLAGSLYTLWPWRRLVAVEGMSGRFNNGPIAAVDAVSGQPLSFALCLLLMAAGFVLVWGLERLGAKSGVKSSSSGQTAGKTF